MRHGETVCNRDGIIQGPRVDAELSDTGRLQAQRLRDAFDATRLDHVYVSPMQRARDTAEAVSAGHGVPMEVVPELYEMDFGDLCGRPVPEGRPVLDQLEQDWQMGFLDRALPGGESPVLVQHRIRSFVHRILQGVGDIGVVAHGRLNRVLLTALLGQPLQGMHRFPQANASITHIELDGSGAHLRRLNDTTHLL